MRWPHDILYYYLVISLCCVLAQSLVIDEDLYGDRCERISYCSFTCDASTLSICQCDSLCVLYGDCCTEASRKPCNSTSTKDVLIPPFSCQDSNSISKSNSNDLPVIDRNLGYRYSFWYWMVTTCPDDWVMTGHVIGQELRKAIENECMNTTQRLPPATDMNTGFDYRNEYCAICNRVNPEHIIRWEYNYECEDHYQVIMLLERTDNFTLIMEGLEKFCYLAHPVKPSFNLLSTGQPAPPERPCYQTTPPSCLDRDTLQNVTGIEWNETMYQTVTERCFGITQAPVVNDSNLLFRNIDCALCNGITEDEIYYLCTIFRDPARTPQLPFSVFLDIHKDGLILISSGPMTTTLQVSCSQTEIYDPALGACRSIEFQECIRQTRDGATSATLVNGKCITCNKQLVALNDPSSFSIHNSTVVSYENEIYSVEYTNEQGQPVICANITSGGVPVIDNACNGSLISLNESDIFSYVGADIVAYGSEVYTVEFNNSMGEPVICVDFSNNGTLLTNTTVEYYGYPTGFYVLTYIGCSLSVIGCILVLLTYSLFKELRTLPSMILMNLNVAILITYVLILIGGPVARAFPDVVDLCVAIGILLHYFSLSQFSWMSIMSLELARTFYQAYKLRATETKRSKCIVFTIYIIFGWSLPLLISVASIIVNYTTEDLVLYGVLEDGTQGSCWINHVQSAIVAMVVPVAISLAFNTIMFAIVALFLIQAYRSQSRIKKMSKSNISYFRLTVAVFTISGITWGVGFIAILVRTPWLWYPFIILNSIQGLVIFLAFLCTKKVGKLYLSLLMSRIRSKRESSIATKQSAVGPQQNKMDISDNVELNQ